MQFESLNEFLLMGGYGLYVWLSFGVAIASLGGLVVMSRWERKQLIEAIGQEQQRRARIKAARQQQQQESVQTARSEELS